MVHAVDACADGEQRGELVPGGGRVPGTPGPVGQVEPGHQGIGGVRTEYALADSEKDGELVPGGGHVPGVAREVGEVVTVDQGVGMLGAEDALGDRQ